MELPRHAIHDPAASIRDLTEALARCHPDGVRLYTTSAVFHASLRTLAELLPAWVNGFAEHAAEVNAISEAKMRELINPNAGTRQAKI